jgi:hypothetical protein
MHYMHVEYLMNLIVFNAYTLLLQRVVEQQKVKMFNIGIQMMNPDTLDRYDILVSCYCLRLSITCM